MSIEAMSWVLKHSEARLGERLVLIVLADKANDDGTGAWPSVKTIAREARLSRKQVQNVLAKLRDTGKIIPVGTHQSGTVIYDVVMGGVNIALGVEQSTAEGGVIHDQKGRNPRPNEVARITPEPSLEQPPGTVLNISGPSLPKVVERKPVTAGEGELAVAVLAEWNDQAGQKLASTSWLAKIVMRVREHPELEIDDHAHVIAAALRDPWWKGPATPSVVYGSDAQFERSMLAAQRTNVSDAKSVFDIATDELSRIERGAA